MDDYLHDETLQEWMRNDICWCTERACPYEDCFRNQIHRDKEFRYFTAAMLKGTDMCPHANQLGGEIATETKPIVGDGEHVTD